MLVLEGLLKQVCLNYSRIHHPFLFLVVLVILSIVVYIMSVNEDDDRNGYI